MMSGTSFRRRPKSCPRSTSTVLTGASREASKPRERPTGKRSAPTREKRHRRGCGAFRETGSGRPGRSSRDSRVAHQPEDRCRSASDHPADLAARNAVVEILIAAAADEPVDKIEKMHRRQMDCRAGTAACSGYKSAIAVKGSITPCEPGHQVGVIGWLCYALSATRPCWPYRPSRIPAKERSSSSVGQCRPNGEISMRPRSTSSAPSKRGLPFVGKLTSWPLADLTKIKPRSCHAFKAPC